MLKLAIQERFRTNFPLVEAKLSSLDPTKSGHFLGNTLDILWVFQVNVSTAFL